MLFKHIATMLYLWYGLLCWAILDSLLHKIMVVFFSYGYGVFSMAPCPTHATTLQLNYAFNSLEDVLLPMATRQQNPTHAKDSLIKIWSHTQPFSHFSFLVEQLYSPIWWHYEWWHFGLIGLGITVLFSGMPSPNGGAMFVSCWNASYWSRLDMVAHASWILSSVHINSYHHLGCLFQISQKSLLPSWILSRLVWSMVPTQGMPQESYLAIYHHIL